jgi:glycosyltransferase involved in cell wall biosynthesis
MKICHIGSMSGNIDTYGQITRDVFYKCEGDHTYENIYFCNSDADIYLVHNFRNPKYLAAFKNFKAKGKIISLIHSSFPCMPCDSADVVVTISWSWQNRLKQAYGINSRMIRGSLDCKMFDDVKINYSGDWFGKHSRLEKGKYHEKWIDIADKVDGIRFDCNDGFKISDIATKKTYLSNLSVYADLHDDTGLCEETFSMSLLEAMACGLPCIILGKGQPAMCEVLSDAGIICNSVDEFEASLNELIQDTEMKEYYGMKAKARAKLFDNDKMIEEYNQLFKDVLK